MFCLTHNYTAYPMVRQARDMVRAGAIGPVRQIQAGYVQGHNATLVEGEGTPNWRFDPDACGPSLILGDIGTHAHHLVAFVSGLELEEVMAEVWASVPGRRADDTASVLMRWSGGARGSMWVTNAAAGADHGLGFRIFGEQGGLEWWQEQPNELRHRRLGGFEQVLTRRLHGALTPSADAPRGSRSAIPRAIRRPSPTSTRTRPRRSRPGSRASRAIPWRWISRPSRMGRAGSL